MRQSVYTTYSLILAILLLFAFCGQTNRKAEDKEYVVDKKLDGYWILTNYVDDILKTKSIAPHVTKRLIWNAIVLKIDGDSLATHGLITGKKLRLSNDADSLTTIRGLNYYQLSYDRSLRQIRATATNEKSDKKDTVTYYFRRAKPEEQRLIAGINGRPFYEHLQNNFYEYFIDSIISGTYRPISKEIGLKTLELEKDSKTSGFKNYNRYPIHDYFGTLHPYSGNDAIVFEDTTINPSENAPMANFGVYSWKFNGDTLLLTEMLTETYDTYYPGTKTHKLLRSKQYSR